MRLALLRGISHASLKEHGPPSTPALLSPVSVAGTPSIQLCQSGNWESSWKLPLLHGPFIQGARSPWSISAPAAGCPPAPQVAVVSGLASCHSLLSDPLAAFLSTSFHHPLYGWRWFSQNINLITTSRAPQSYAKNLSCLPIDSLFPTQSSSF